MSFRIAVQAFDAKVGNPLRKLVLLKLADQANDDGLCWPSYDTVAKACEISRRSVIRHIQQLEEDGFLRIERVYDKEAKKNKSNRYHLTIPNGEIKSLVTESHHPSDTESPLDSDTESLGSDTESPKPTIESISKPIIETKDWINESFEAFYESYPNKKGRGQAQKTWNNVFLGKGDHKKPSNPVELFETIMNAVKVQTPVILLSEPRFRKHPSTWLNAQAWLDEIEQSQPTNTFQGNTHANNQPANSQYQPKQSAADIYAANIARELAEYEAAH